MTLLNTLIDLLNFKLIIVSVLFFFGGYAFAPYVYHKKIKVAMAYPLWINNRLQELINRRWPPVLLFFFILIFNTFSLFITLISALIPIISLVFIFGTGFNIGIIAFHSFKGKFYYSSLINPVALFEFIAALITFVMALNYNVQHYAIFEGLRKYTLAIENPLVYLELFLFVCLPVLCIAAVIEVIIMIISQNIEKE